MWHFHGGSGREGFVCAPLYLSFLEWCWAKLWKWFSASLLMSLKVHFFWRIHWRTDSITRNEAVRSRPKTIQMCKNTSEIYTSIFLLAPYHKVSLCYIPFDDRFCWKNVGLASLQTWCPGLGKKRYDFACNWVSISDMEIINLYYLYKSFLPLFFITNTNFVHVFMWIHCALFQTVMN